MPTTPQSEASCWWKTCPRILIRDSSMTHAISVKRWWHCFLMWLEKKENEKRVRNMWWCVRAALPIRWKKIGACTMCGTIWFIRVSSGLTILQVVRTLGIGETWMRRKERKGKIVRKCSKSLYLLNANADLWKSVSTIVTMLWMRWLSPAHRPTLLIISTINRLPIRMFTRAFNVCCATENAW